MCVWSPEGYYFCGWRVVGWLIVQSSSTGIRDEKERPGNRFNTRTFWYSEVYNLHWNRECCLLLEQTPELGQSQETKPQKNTNPACKPIQESSPSELNVANVALIYLSWWWRECPLDRSPPPFVLHFDPHACLMVSIMQLCRPAKHSADWWASASGRGCVPVQWVIKNSSKFN